MRRPHHTSLYYIGDDTRIIVDHRSSLSDLILHLSETLHNTTKYQILNKDSDSSISVTTDEDLENMINEYDRLSQDSGAGKSIRLQLFMFPVKLESVTSIGSLLKSNQNVHFVPDSPILEMTTSFGSTQRKFRIQCHVVSIKRHITN